MPIDYRRLFAKLFYLFLLPLVISLIHSLFTMFCSLSDGLLFYFVIALPSVFVGLGIAVVSILLTNKIRKTIFLFIVILLALVPVLEIYFFPQIYFYSSLIGFFPGNIYDEGLSPDWQLVLHQLLILLYVILIIYSYYKWKNHIQNFKIKFVIFIVSVFVMFEIVSSYLGFTTPYSRLNNYLPEKIITENTVLHFDKLKEGEAKFIALNQQYYYEKLSKELKLNVKRKIDVYLFNSREQKKTLFGAGNADVAKPWQYSVYISKESWDQTLQHEMIHVFSAEFGTGIFKLASGLNSAMIEGMAESIDNNVDNYTVVDLASLAYKNGYRINIRDLFEGLNFFKQNSTLSYTYSGAFFKFLNDKFGIAKLKEFYAEGSFKKIFGEDIESLKNDFEKVLQSSPDIGNENMANYYFGRLSIIQKICPRFVSDRLRKAWKYFYDSDLKKAEALFIEVNDKIINYSALTGLSEIYFKQGKINSAINLLNLNLNKLSNTPYYFNLQLKLADFYILSNQRDSAAVIYENLQNENANYYLSSLANVRLELLKIDKLKNYLEGTDSIRYKILFDLNEQNYFYDSIELLLLLAKENNIDYKSLQRIFNKTFFIEDIESSYAVFKLSQYLLETGNYSGSRKMAALCLRFKVENPFYNAFIQNYDKVSWFYYYANEKISSFKYQSKNLSQK